MPTNAQLVLDLLRDGERRRSPLPPAPEPDAAPADTASQVEDREDDDGKDDSVDAKATRRREDLVADLSHVAQKGKETSRAKMRKAWDRLGKTKEDVSSVAHLSLAGPNADLKGFAILAGHKTIDVQGNAEVRPPS